MTNRKFGIRMDGVGMPLEYLIQRHLAAQPVDDYTLIEVGSAGCTSLRAFADILTEARAGKPWRAIGFDLLPGQAWSLDMEEVKRSFAGLPYRVLQEGVDEYGAALDDGMALVLLSDPRTYLRDSFPRQIDFCFIDGSHGKSCGLDFLAIEPKVRPGGLVVFHDYGEPEQGTDWQSWDREFISVRNYVHRLGLAEPCPEQRKGWRFVGEIKGSRHWGGDGNSCAVVQRTFDPLETQPKLTLD